MGLETIRYVSLGRDSGADAQARSGRNQATAENDTNISINYNNLYTPAQNTIAGLEELCGDGVSLGIYKCGSRRCNFQNKYIPRDRAISSGHTDYMTVKYQQVRCTLIVILVMLFI